MQDKTPLVSVVMSIYNDGKFAREAVKSVLDQSFADFEFIIVDDGAVDDSAGIVSSFNDPRISLIRQKNKGLASALNLGIRFARGRVIARQDGDDISGKYRLENQIQFLLKNPEVGLVGCDAWVIGENGERIQRTKFPVDDQDMKKVLFEKQENPFVHGAVMFRKNIAEKVGFYRAEFKKCQDIDLWLRMAEVTSLASIPDTLYSWRFRKGSISIDNRVTTNEYARLAHLCGHNRRIGKREPLLTVKGITRTGFVNFTNSFRVLRDEADDNAFSFAQTLFLSGKIKEARDTFKKVVKKYPSNLYAWFLLFLCVLPRRISLGIWSFTQKAYRKGTWRV
ncbi:glycosyltransferase [Candidatus Omnitrophota bacterium]